jgi:hypothetical protein
MTLSQQSLEQLYSCCPAVNSVASHELYGDASPPPGAPGLQLYSTDIMMSALQSVMTDQLIS